MREATIVEGSISVAVQPTPQPGFGQIMVAVRAAGVNGADVMQMKGRYPSLPNVPKDLPGLEFSGEVVALGPGASRFSVGDRVMALVAGAAQAEFAVVHEREAMAVPEGVSWLCAGGFPEAAITAYDALFSQAGLAMGERVLINGAGGGVGTAAVQMAKIAGADVVASVRSSEVRECVSEFGVTAIGPDKTSDHGPYDVVLELVSGANLADSLSSLNPCGRVIIVGVSSGPTAELDFRLLMRTRARIFGSSLRSRVLEEKADAVRRVERHVVPHLASGRFIVPLHGAFSLDEVEKAYAAFNSPGKFGKIVLDVA